MPGYTGFVPTKQAIFGKTSGSINREIVLTGGRPEELDRLELTRHLEQASNLPTQKDINPDVYGNHSKTRLQKLFIAAGRRMLRIMRHGEAASPIDQKI